MFIKHEFLNNTVIGTSGNTISSSTTTTTTATSSSSSSSLKRHPWGKRLDRVRELVDEHIPSIRPKIKDIFNAFHQMVSLAFSDPKRSGIPAGLLLRMHK